MLEQPSLKLQQEDGTGGSEEGVIRYRPDEEETDGMGMLKE